MCYNSSMEIAVEQIRAARALLQWSQKELARKSNISIATLQNIERNLSHPRPDTLQNIRTALEIAGICFLPSLGVKLSAGEVGTRIFEGQNALFLLWNDIYDTLEPGEERLINGVEENTFLKNESRFDDMMKRYKDKGISGRILSKYGDSNFADPSSYYRWVPKEQFSALPYFVYGTKYALLLWEPVLRVLVIDNAAIAASYRQQFNVLWDEAYIPPAYLHHNKRKP